MVILTVASGVGLPIYIAGWLLLPPADGSPAIAARLRARPGAWQIGAGVGCLTLGGLLTIRELGLWWSDAIVWPFVLAAAGAGDALAPDDGAPRRPRADAFPTRRRADGRARAGDRARHRGARARRRRAPAVGLRPPQRLRSIYQGGFGIALVVGAGLLFLQANGALSGARDLVLAFVVVALGLGLILAPLWLRLVRGLRDERDERIRSQERAEVAAHLHDSVLQTLALVQKRADDPRAVATLPAARSASCAAWLRGARGRPDECLADALAAAAAEEIERGPRRPDRGRRRRRPRPSTSAAARSVAAAREALANAVRHSSPATSRSRSTPRSPAAAPRCSSATAGQGFDRRSDPRRPARRARVDYRSDGPPRRQRRPCTRRPARAPRSSWCWMTRAVPTVVHRRRPRAVPRRRARRARRAGGRFSATPRRRGGGRVHRRARARRRAARRPSCRAAAASRCCAA